ncbi:GNAT family N-acetyltransferase [Phyllobacterium sp. YR531]|uniref:GNAT family N-acetyltransferase n=1 Tax=Phyllobacterium sp. YR531 TaxID=1144343 RepID=UPI00026F8782|nr:GNAT family N-acetyltransferase [Phyllobacterium sp. YR531]EJM99604.1 putative acetyltransferase [Phyllobacterium sp. YR531]
MITRVEPLEHHPELVPLCARWNYEAWGRDDGRSREEIVESFLNFLSPESRQKALVGFVSGLPVGLSLLIDHDLDSHPHLHPWLASLYVTPEMRLLGVGKALVEATEKAAQLQGHGQLYLYTAETGYYERMGWQKVEELHGDNAGMWILQKPLKKPLVM